MDFEIFLQSSFTPTSSSLLLTDFLQTVLQQEQTGTGFGYGWLGMCEDVPG